MIAYGVPIYKLSVNFGNFNPNKSNPRWGQQKMSEIRCCKQRMAENARAKKNYYELLGVSADSNLQEIKEAYRRLQKKYHPDIVGQEGHEYTLMLNEAYEVLIKDDLRRDYDSSMDSTIIQFGRNVSGYSSWKGTLRPQALFVDGSSCIGCRECVHHASNTFVMDEALGCARVKIQYGDDDEKINVSVDSCPVNCIHWVDREELAVLEFLTQPQPKEGFGIFGGGWERPENVFMAAKAFSKQLKQQTEADVQQRGRVKVEEETPAQAEARAKASMNIKMESFNRIWNNLKPFFGSKYGIGSEMHDSKEPF